MAVPGAVPGLWAAHAARRPVAVGVSCSSPRSSSPRPGSRSPGSCRSRSPTASTRSPRARRWRRSCCPTAGCRAAAPPTVPANGCSRRRSPRRCGRSPPTDRRRCTAARWPTRSRARSPPTAGSSPPRTSRSTRRWWSTRRRRVYRDLQYVTCRRHGRLRGARDPRSLRPRRPPGRAARHRCTCSPRRWVTRSPTGPPTPTTPDFAAEPIAELGRARVRGDPRGGDQPRPGGAASDRRDRAVAGARSRRPGRASAGGVHGTTQVVAGRPRRQPGRADHHDRGGLRLAGRRCRRPGSSSTTRWCNYDPRPGRSNSIAPGKMPFFAVPAIVAARDGRAAFAAAGSGGYPILAGVIATTVRRRRPSARRPGGDRRAAGPLPGQPHVRRLPGRARGDRRPARARP